MQLELVLVALALAVVALTAVMLTRRSRPPSIPSAGKEVAPALRLRAVRDDLYVTPQLIEVPPSGRLRIGYHPPFMDRHVGGAEFRQLPFVDIRGNAAAVHELSRHVACVWRDGSHGDCFIQLGWPGPGEPIRPRGQTRVLRLGRPHDAASQPFRLAHGDVLRLSSGVEYVFLEVDTLRDRTTPEQRKIDALEADQSDPLRAAHDARR
jgi:hypothetical protein